MTTQPDPAQPTITPAQVAKVAALARLTLTPAELQAYTSQLATILAHAADVAALDVADLPPTAHPLPLSNVTRPDQVRPVLARDEVLSAAPDPAEGQFRVPPILGEAP